MISQILQPAGATLLCYVVLFVARYVYREYTSPLRHVGGPKSPSFIFGNFQQMTDDAQLTKKWHEQYGPIFLFKGLFSTTELHTSDLKAVNHIMSNSTIYQRPPHALESARRMLGRGVLSVTQDEHKHQASVEINPAFATPQIRLMTEVFAEKALRLRDIWAAQATQEHGAARVDVMSWLRKMTLDVIGQAGFNYEFHALDAGAKPNELNQVFTDLFHSPQAGRINMVRIAQGMLPLLRFVPMPGGNVSNNARIKMMKIGSQILADSKAAIKAAGTTKELDDSHDLLSVLLRANMSPDIPESQRMTDAEAIAQIPGFFVAGHETTSSATSWALHALSLNKAVQVKLREELMSLSTDNPTMDELNSLPYLEMVVRETMRVHAPVVFINRMAMEDDVLPLAKPYIDKNGHAHESLPIPKGLVMHVPIQTIHTDPEIWGPDAAEFRPERWEKVPNAANAIPGVWANLLTFFGGPHNCIGFRFSLVEMKTLLFTLLRALEFEPAVPKGGIAGSSSLLQRPVVVGEPENGSQLPLIVKPLNTEAF
ncbi:cytochrome P450 [Mycena belliarum]|uniref:Cytochrome P450 n=1 Tax=Mycena belliarum TaxID=1033014 RepID=A0AAD6U498_9AGAR|nr:cytochrome P450 [Mycena belliae]